MNWESKCVLGLISLSMLACASGPTTVAGTNREIIDASYRISEPPKWLRETATSWEQGEDMFIKAAYSVSGDKRINGCYDMAKAEIKEALISELANDIVGENVRATTGINEGGDEISSKSLVEKLHGDTRGLRFVENAYERYQLSGAERIECFVLGRIKKSDYNAVKMRVAQGMGKKLTPVGRVVEQRQENFLGRDTASDSVQRDDINGNGNSTAEAKQVVPNVNPLPRIKKTLVLPVEDKPAESDSTASQASGEAL